MRINKGTEYFVMSNEMFEKMVGLHDGAAQELISQQELDQELTLVPFVEIKGQAGSKIGWKDTGTAKGRGVFARKNIAKGEMIECAPVVIVAEADVPESGGAPDGYLLDWEPEEKGQEHCMPLGYTMLFNHDKDGNLYLENDYEAMTITSYAARDIKAGEELTWNYDCDIWFDEG